MAEIRAAAAETPAGERELLVAELLGIGERMTVSPREAREVAPGVVVVSASIGVSMTADDVVEALMPEVAP